jgi:hypothetical protein
MAGRQDGQIRKYSGAHSLANLPSAPDYAWQRVPVTPPAAADFTTAPPTSLYDFIPDHTSTSSERFHINFWFGNYSAGENPNPPPSSKQEVIITNFEFQP